MFTDPCLTPGKAFMQGHDQAVKNGGLSPPDFIADNEQWSDNPVFIMIQEAYWAPQNYIGTITLNYAAFRFPRDNSILPFWADLPSTKRPDCGCTP
jgi:hypothetical protein